MNAAMFRSVNVMCWNVRGMNAVRKWDSIRNKIVEANCDIICYQETKKENIDQRYLRKVLLASFDAFVFPPSVGASGGLLVAWRSNLSDGSLKLSTSYALAVQFTSKLNCAVWNLINIYGPCTNEGRVEFCDWLKSVDMEQDEDWILLGNFNMYRYPKNRNKPGADLAVMSLFNNIISFVGLDEIPLQGRNFT